MRAPDGEPTQWPRPSRSGPGSLAPPSRSITVPGKPSGREGKVDIIRCASIEPGTLLGMVSPGKRRRAGQPTESSTSQHPPEGLGVADGVAMTVVVEVGEDLAPCAARSRMRSAHHAGRRRGRTRRRGDGDPGCPGGCPPRRGRRGRRRPVLSGAGWRSSPRSCPHRDGRPFAGARHEHRLGLGRPEQAGGQRPVVAPAGVQPDADRIDLRVLDPDVPGDLHPTGDGPGGAPTSRLSAPNQTG